MIGRCWRVGFVVFASLGGLGFSSGAVSAQDLADFDYENLTLRGIGLEAGRMWPNNVDPTYSLGVVFDLGFLGPGLRLNTTVGYWDGDLKRSKVASFERRLEMITGDAVSVDLGTIEWSDLTVGVDGQYVWSIPFNFLTYAGLGVTAHFMNGSGPSIDDTFVEDLLDRVTLGLNGHVGIEYPFTDQFRVYVTPRYEILDDLRFAEVRFGAKFLFGPLAPGESRNR